LCGEERTGAEMEKNMVVPLANFSHVVIDQYKVSRMMIGKGKPECTEKFAVTPELNLSLSNQKTECNGLNCEWPCAGEWQVIKNNFCILNGSILWSN
jgi:hypothetical protein